VLVFQTTSTGVSPPPIAVTAPDSTAVSCQPLQYGQDECATSQQGTYTVAVTSDYVAYTLAYTALLTEPGSTCPTVSLSLAASSVTGSLMAGQAGACYSLSAASGHILYAFGVSYVKQVQTAIFDAAGNLVCAQVTGTCTLTGTGPYRMLASDAGQADSYEFQYADVTEPSGCAPVAQQAFGQVPALSADLCSSLTVTTAGNYQIYTVDQHFATQQGTLYSASGGQACPSTGAFCQLAPGTYNFVQDYLLYGDKVGTVFIAAAESRGCVLANDTAFASGDATGSFAGPGEELCRTLPTRAGVSDYLYSQPVTSGTPGQVLEVVDSTGTPVCTDAFTYWSFATCALTGTAPFRVIVAPGGPNSHVRLLVQRTNSTAGCATWKRSGYGNNAGAHVSLTHTNNARCFVIPAAGRTAAELVEDADLTDGASAALIVDDPSGQRLCTGNGYPTDWTICDYKTDVRYTAILVDTFNTPRTGKPETYYLARRDLTGHATCSSPVATSPGRPPTSFTLGSSTAARCFRVNAAKADKLMFAFRDSVPTDSSAFQVPPALLVVTNRAGTVVCAWDLFCPAAGSARYQAVVITLDYTKVAITAHLDTLVVANSAGWLPACQRNQFSSGITSAAVRDTLTDRADLYCAVVNVQPNQDLTFYGSDTTSFPNRLWIDAYAASSWLSPNPGICSVGFAWCDILPVQQPTQALLIVAPFNHSQDPISFDMQAVCRFDCSVQPPTPVYQSISPKAQAAGPANNVVLTGTVLSFTSPFNLIAQDGSTYAPGVPLAVNPAGTRLTLRLDTTAVPPGTYDVSLGDSCSPAPCSDWLLNAYTVTKAPTPPTPTRFVPLTPARILDSQTGVDVRRGRVPAHRTVTFPVTGHAGVPTSGVAAVVLDVSALSPSRAGYLTVYPGGRARPPAETVNFIARRAATGLVTVPVVNGRVAVYNGSAGPVGLTADVVGYDTTGPTGTGFTPVGLARILRAHRVQAKHALTLKVAGVRGVPTRGVKAVVVDVSVSGPADAGRLIAYGNGIHRPDVTSLSFAAGQKVTELAVARVIDGKVDLYNASGGSLTLAADAVGYYSAGGAHFIPVNAKRVMDTRSGFGEAGEAILPHAAAILNPLWNTAPSGNVTAVALNVTVLGAQSAGALQVFPDGPLYQDGIALPNSTSLPGTPNVAFQPGRAQSNLVIVPTGALADFYNGSNGKIQVVAQIEGYYTS